MAPLRSISVLIAMVEPWISSSMAAACEPALADAVDDALHELRRRGEALGLDETPGRVVESDQVGEGASDIDCDDDHAENPPAFLGWESPP